MRRRTLIWLTTLFVLVAGLAVPWQSAEADDEFPTENAWHRITPSVVWCGEADSLMTIEVHIVGRTDVIGVEVTDGGSAGDRIVLYDDGTHGDAAAGDNVFTNSSVQPYCNPDWLLSSHGGAKMWWGMLRVQLSDGREIGHNYGMTAGLVHPDFKDVFDVVDLGNGLSATAYAFFIEDDQNEVFDGYPVAELFCGRGNYEAFLKFYSVMPDDFDFTLLMPGMQMLLPGNYRENTPYDVLVSNSVQNIGMDIMDRSALFGSAGRLKSMIFHSFGLLAIFDHEVVHSWGPAIGYSLGLVGSSGNQGHFNEMSDIAGQMTSFYFADSGDVGRFAYNGDGTWHLVSNHEIPPYSPLELYIMGLIPPEEVPPIHILQSPNLSDPERITSASYQTITIEQIMAAEGGPRIPSSDEAQKDFTLAYIVTQDVPYNDAAYAFFSLLSYDLMSLDPPHSYGNLAPFHWATGGRATLDTRLPVDVPDPTGPEPLPAPTAAPTSTEETPAATTEPDSPTATTEPAGDEPEATPTPGTPPFCPSALIGMIAAPGLLLLLSRRKRVS
jgi:hypothetical protein